jgi:hypothetical protein
LREEGDVERDLAVATSAIAGVSLMTALSDSFSRSRQ